MKYIQEDIALLFEKIGIARWDFMPPQEGKIKFMNEAGEKIAEGDYKIILSYGPEEKYTMAWSIYPDSFPTVGKDIAGEKKEIEPATMDDAWKKSVEIGEAVKADFVYAASWIFVAVFKFKILLNPEKIKEFSLGERLNAMLKDLGSDN
jgi:hypothetical protein